MSETKYMMGLVVEAIEYYGGEAKIIDISRYLWGKYENDFRAGGDLFYRWQYVMRWAATKLRKQGILRASESTRSGIWSLTQK